MNAQCEADRMQDAMYRMLTLPPCRRRTELVRGIRKLVAAHSKHPAVRDKLQTDTAATEKVLLVAAMYAEPDFIAYVMDQPGVPRSAVSEFIAQEVPPLIDRLLNGNVSVRDFVADVTYAYVKL